MMILYRFILDPNAKVLQQRSQEAPSQALYLMSMELCAYSLRLVPLEMPEVGMQSMGQVGNKYLHIGTNRQ